APAGNRAIRLDERRTAFGTRIVLADFLHALHAHVGYFEGDAAGPVRHEDWGAPTIVRLRGLAVGPIAYQIIRAALILAPDWDASACAIRYDRSPVGKIGLTPCFMHPQSR